MNLVSTATYLGVQQAATTNGVTLPLNLIRQLTRTLVIARIVALSTQALAYFLLKPVQTPVALGCVSMCRQAAIG